MQNGELAPGSVRGPPPLIKWTVIKKDIQHQLWTFIYMCIYAHSICAYVYCTYVTHIHTHVHIPPPIKNPRKQFFLYIERVEFKSSLLLMLVVLGKPLHATDFQCLRICTGFSGDIAKPRSDRWNGLWRTCKRSNDNSTQSSENVNFQE